MKTVKFISIFSLLLFLSCNKKTTQEEIQAIENNEKESIENYDEIYANAGQLVNDISINLTPTKEQEKEWGNELVSYINIENATDELNRLQNAAEIIVPETKVKLVIEYPLKNVAIFELSNSNGFSRKDLILSINQKYQEIYAEEEQTATVKTIPINERKGLINRNETNGKYGIWGHDLQDLDLSGIEVYKNNNGEITLIPQIES